MTERARVHRNVFVWVCVEREGGSVFVQMCAHLYVCLYRKIHRQNDKQTK